MGGVLNRVSRAAPQHNFTGRSIRIHGHTYRFTRKLGEGGFGAVYSARAPNGANVAIKVIDLSRMPGSGSTLADSYLNEVKHLERLRRDSRHVVEIFDFDFDPHSGRAYIIMELGGDNLDKLIHRSRQFFHGPHGPGTFTDPTIRKEVWRQLVSIVGTLTTNNIVHMDLKPANLILFGRTLKIADLGISKKADLLGFPRVGTPGFSAPEIMQDHSDVRKPYGPKADIWSLGAILYYITYGAVPKYEPHASRPPPGQLPARDPALVDMLRRTLALNPHHRADINAVLHHPYTRR